ncbi:inositol monophosphatase family protein [Nocardia sp. 004]|uniref:inositol monophosphatase family protein n=1 Tax=Nocardia sp. 004 TaxID=3385978 RepID=UPI00399FBF63
MEGVPETPSPVPEVPASPFDSTPIVARGDEADLRRIAVDLAESAAAHIRARRPEVFGSAGGHAEGAVRAKSHATDPVTIVDTEAEELIRRMLAEQRPGDPIVGEEGGGSIDDTSADTVYWVVDPIDGTVNFLYGIPGYAVSVAAMRGGRTVAGAVVDVARAETYSAALGLGALCVGHEGTVEHLTCGSIESLSMALVATGFAYGIYRRTEQAELVARVLPHVRDIRRFGAGALDLCHVAAGRVDAYYEHGLNVWDWGAGALIATEAGARLTVPAATATGDDGDLVVAAAPGIADELAALLDRVGAAEPIPDR